MALANIAASIATLAIAALVFACGQACANDRTMPSQPNAGLGTALGPQTLEQQFWACDYGAATRGIVGAEAQACVANFEALKSSKFAGDFSALLSWWGKNKDAQHAAHSRSDRALRGR